MPIEQVNIALAVKDEHGPIFYELIELMIECLRSGGIQASCTTKTVMGDRLNVFLGATIFLPPEILTNLHKLPYGYVAFQLEALDSAHGYSTNRPHYFEFLKGAKQVWDYSQQNTRYLAGLGFNNVRYIPVGYSPRLSRIADAGQLDIDVLFYVSMSPRRRQVLEELRLRGFRTEVLFGKYGSSRDAYIARAKIQLNIYQFDTPQLEQLRLAYLLNNKRFVISETSKDNPYGDGVVFCDYKDIVARCYII
jgi:hypothetical protein